MPWASGSPSRFMPAAAVAGGHGDFVWEQGSFADPPAHGLETWFIRGGSAGAAVYTFRQPGLYAYLTHNLSEAVELGALAHVMVEGAWDDDLMTQVMPPGPMTALLHEYPVGVGSRVVGRLWP